MQKIQRTSRFQFQVSSLDTAISLDNPIRFIEAFVIFIDFKQLDFKMAIAKAQVNVKANFIFKVAYDLK